MSIISLLIDHFLMSDNIKTPEEIQEHKIKIIQEKNKEKYISLCRKLNKYIYKNFDEIKKYSKLIDDNPDNNHEIYNELLLSNILKKDKDFFSDIILEVNNIIDVMKDYKKGKKNYEE